MTCKRPGDAELLTAVLEFLESDVKQALTASDTQFKLRIAANVLRIVRRDCEKGLQCRMDERERLQQLLASSQTDLDKLSEHFCDEIRRGAFDDRHDELKQVLTEITLDRLSIDNPRYSTYIDLKA